MRNTPSRSLVSRYASKCRIIVFLSCTDGEISKGKQVEGHRIQIRIQKGFRMIEHHSASPCSWLQAPDSAQRSVASSCFSSFSHRSQSPLQMCKQSAFLKSKQSRISSYGRRCQYKQSRPACRLHHRTSMFSLPYIRSMKRRRQSWRLMSESTSIVQVLCVRVWRANRQCRLDISCCSPVLAQLRLPIQHCRLAHVL